MRSSGKAVAAQIRRLRLRLGLTQREFGRRIGVNQQRISQIESGRGGLTLKLLDRIARSTGAPLEIRLGDADPVPYPPLAAGEREEIVKNVRWFSRLGPLQKIRVIETHNETMRRFRGGRIQPARTG